LGKPLFGFSQFKQVKPVSKQIGEIVSVS